MGTLALLLVIICAVGLFGLQVRAVINGLLIIVIIAVLLRVIRAGRL
jgi:hypothetical protein